MNKDVWNALPKEGKAYIEKNWDHFSLRYAAGYDLAHAKAKELFLKTPGKEVINFVPGERVLAPIKNSPFSTIREFSP